MLYNINVTDPVVCNIPSTCSLDCRACDLQGTNVTLVKASSRYIPVKPDHIFNTSEMI